MSLVCSALSFPAYVLGLISVRRPRTFPSCRRFHSPQPYFHTHPHHPHNRIPQTLAHITPSHAHPNQRRDPGNFWIFLRGGRAGVAKLLG